MPRIYKRKTTEEFIAEAKAIHGDTYSYPSPYVHSREKIKIQCPAHGAFFQYPYSHLAGNGCSHCDTAQRAKHNTHTHEEFIAKALAVHGHRYTYVTKYTHSQAPVTVMCPLHGEFNQLPAIHLRGHGCVKCRISPVRPKPQKKSGGSGTYGPSYFETYPAEKDTLGYFYVVRLTVQETPLLKIGITKNIEKRLTNYSRFNGELVLVKDMTLYGAYLHEQRQLDQLAQFTYTGPLYFSGYTECFTISVDEYKTRTEEDNTTQLTIDL